MSNDNIIEKLLQVVNISQSDTDAGYLVDKLVAGTGISFTVNTAADGSQTLTVDGSSGGGTPAVFIQGDAGGDYSTSSATLEAMPQMSGSIAAVEGDKLLVNVTIFGSFAAVTNFVFFQMAYNSSLSDTTAQIPLFTADFKHLISFSFGHTVVAGDLSGANVPFELYWARGGSTFSVMNGTGAVGEVVPLMQVTNLGQ